MAPPSVAKQFKTLVAPDLLNQGFCDSGKTYWRVSGEVLQAIFIHVESRIRREFTIEYCAFLVCVPHTFHTLDHGGRFPVGTRGRSYPADTPERLESSMLSVKADIPGLLAFFRSTQTIEGYIQTYLAHIANQPAGLIENGHTSFALASGYVAAGNLEVARPFAVKALSEFDNILTSYRAIDPKGSHWAPEWIERSQSLIAAIDNKSTASLLEEWRAFTTNALKLDSRQKQK